MNEILTIGEAARLLQVDVVTLRRWERRGKLLPAARIGKRMRIYRREDLERVRREDIERELQRESKARRRHLGRAGAAGQPEHHAQGGERDATTT